MEWRGMARICPAEGSARRIDHDIRRARKERRARLMQDRAEALIQLGEKFPRRRRLHAQFLDEPAHDRRDQRGAHAVSHHIANQHARLRVREREHVEEIAAELGAREVAMAEPQRAALRWGVRWKNGMAPQQKGGLQLPRHVEIGGHLRVLFAKLPGLLLELLFGTAEFEVFVHRRLVRREEEVDGMDPSGREPVLVACEEDFRRLPAARLAAQLEIREDVLDPREEEFLVVRLHDEIVRAALEPAQDVLGIGQRGEQDDRQLRELRVVLDPLAKLVAIHLRHVDVGDHERGDTGMDRRQRFAAIARGGDAVAVALEGAVQDHRLSRAVLDDENAEGRGGIFAGGVHGSLKVSVRQVPPPSRGPIAIRPRCISEIFRATVKSNL